LSRAPCSRVPSLGDYSGHLICVFLASGIIPATLFARFCSPELSQPSCLRIPVLHNYSAHFGHAFLASLIIPGTWIGGPGLRIIGPPRPRLARRREGGAKVRHHHFRGKVTPATSRMSPALASMSPNASSWKGLCRALSWPRPVLSGRRRWLLWPGLDFRHCWTMAMAKQQPMEPTLP
jgi:hypothetical protein